MALYPIFAHSPIPSSNSEKLELFNPLYLYFGVPLDFPFSSGSWAEQKLLLFFNDLDSEVCQEAAKCFGRLEGQSLESYEDLINKFCDSAACQKNSFSLLQALEESSHRLPGITYIVCEKFLKRFSDEARDSRTGRSPDITFVPKLVFRTYHQHRSDEWAPKCLDLIDQMCLERIYGIVKELDEYER